MVMMVIQQTTEERKEETRKLFKKVKPFLDKGFSYNKSLQKANLLSVNGSWRNTARTRDIIEYAKKQGY